MAREKNGPSNPERRRFMGLDFAEPQTDLASNYQIGPLAGWKLEVVAEDDPISDAQMELKGYNAMRTASGVVVGVAGSALTGATIAVGAGFVADVKSGRRMSRRAALSVNLWRGIGGAVAGETLVGLGGCSPEEGNGTGITPVSVAKTVYTPVPPPLSQKVRRQHQQTPKEVQNRRLLQKS